MTEKSVSDAYDAQGWSAPLYNKAAAFVYSQAFTAPVLDMLAAQPGEKIVDLGCGSGEITLELENVVHQAPGGLVVGVDFSESMIAQAKKIGVKHAFVADIQALESSQLDELAGNDLKFDAAFSNAALHWCKRDPSGVLESVKKVLKPGGRFVAEMGGFLNCIGIRSALHAALRKRGQDPIVADPWFFPSVEDYSQMLTAASFEIQQITLVARVTPLPEGVKGWLECFARTSFLGAFSDAQAAEIIDEVVDALRMDCQDAAGNWAMMYSRLRFCAIWKP
ncbi:unnamed protein product [Mycena citricolor]|uniref:Methyltransferase domain-containing protein n=1 Tax=Mycena citricolor TaxID=2018698 RepID=A0AAD2HSD4_9AGAR|nr:unnamed protein product [Mycena citricolor]